MVATVGPLLQIKKHFECKIVIIFLPTNLNMRVACSKELSQCDRSFEYHQYVLVEKEN